jgi:hypothetical protein
MFSFRGSATNSRGCRLRLLRRSAELLVVHRLRPGERLRKGVLRYMGRCRRCQFLGLCDWVSEKTSVDYSRRGPH